ncbi:MAG: hypothetical protein ABWY55_06690 [Microbacterium sp.]
MQSVLLDTPEGIEARLGWDPKLEERARVHALARELVAARYHVEPTSVRIDYETPAQFGHRTQLQAAIDGEPVPLRIKRASYRASTVVAIADAAVPIGLDVRDLQPDESELRDMRRHSHLLDESNVSTLVAHWTRVKAVISADARGLRVQPQNVRLDTGLGKGWVPDRKVYYKIVDLSRDAWIISLAYGALPA